MARNSSRSAIHGVLLLDKPTGLSSNTALIRAKRALNAAKAGHTGTLDPLASGLLPLCFGEATKFAADLLDADKSYAATLRLGVTTTTGDSEGEVLDTLPVAVTQELLDPVLARLRGPIQQVPPMYSALKRDGKPLYEYARAGITLEREARAVTIHRLEQIAFDGVSLSIVVDCSKGTYIRTLAEDIGSALGCGAHLTALRRTRVGVLDLQHAVTLEAFEGATVEERADWLQPLDALVASLPRIELDATQSARFRQGQRLAMTAELPAGRIRVYEQGGVLLGMAEWRDDHVLAPLRLVATSAV